MKLLFVNRALFLKLCVSCDPYGRRPPFACKFRSVIASFLSLRRFTRLLYRLSVRLSGNQKETKGQPMGNLKETERSLFYFTTRKNSDCSELFFSIYILSRRHGRGQSLPVYPLSATEHFFVLGVAFLRSAIECIVAAQLCAFYFIVVNAENLFHNIMLRPVYVRSFFKTVIHLSHLLLIDFSKTAATYESSASHTLTSNPNQTTA